MSNAMTDPVCHYCGGLNPWGAIRDGGPEFRMCSECLNRDDPLEWYGVDVIETPAEVVELERRHVPLRHEDRRSGPSCNPQWEVKGRKLYIERATFEIPVYASNRQPGVA